MANLSAALEFLEMVTERFPTEEGKRHGLLIVDGKLSLQYWVMGQVRLWPISDPNLSLQAYELIGEFEEAFYGD